MNVAHNGVLGLLGRLGFAARAGLFSVTLLGFGVLCAALAIARQGTAGLLAVGTAVAVCLVAGLAALTAGRLLSRPSQRLHQLAARMVLHNGIPLFAILALQLRGGVLTEAGVILYFLFFYLLMLAAETLLTVTAIPSARKD